MGHYGPAIVYNDNAGIRTAVIIGKLVSHPCQHLLAGNLVTLHGALKTEIERSLDNNNTVNYIEELCFYKYSAFEKRYWSGLATGPLSEIDFHSWMHNAVNGGSMFGGGKKIRSHNFTV